MGIRSRRKGKLGELQAAAKIRRIFRTGASRGRQFGRGFRLHPGKQNRRTGLRRQSPASVNRLFTWRKGRHGPCSDPWR